MSGQPVISIACVDDHPLVRKGVAAILATEPELKLIAEGENADQAVEVFRRTRPDVMLLDLRLPDRTGVEVTKEIRREFPDARIIALTSYDGDQDIYRALEAGVRGYLLKEMVHTEIIRAIRTVHQGKRFIPPEVSQQLSGYFPEVALTPREAEVLLWVARGLGNKEIGEQIGAAAGTVKAHIQNILGKLEAKDRTHAVTIAVQRGIIHLNARNPA
jgi:DNA-binding NarL/FixJ family response regulator